MSKFTVGNVIKELGWMAPELMNDEKFLNEWSQKYWGVPLNQELEAKRDYNIIVTGHRGR